MSNKEAHEASEITIYHAAALFCGRETLFNVELTRRLENDFGYRAILPQRDGFEFSKLHEVLAKHLPADEVSSAVGTIVYCLDAGRFLPRSDVVVANLDEPLDEGVVTEICHAKLAGKPVIGFRTDARSPFGDPGDQFAGMHFFPPYQCDVFIHHPMTCRDVPGARSEMDTLARRIDTAVGERVTGEVSAATDLAATEPVRRCASLLFDGIDDLHTEQSLTKIADRFQHNEEELRRLSPRRR